MFTIPVNMGIEKVNGVRLVSVYAGDECASKEQIEKWATEFADFLYEGVPACFTDKLTRRFEALIEGKERTHEPAFPPSE